MESGPGLDTELESFRRQWLSEVRTKQGEHHAQRPGQPSGASSSAGHPVVAASSRKSTFRPPSATNSRQQTALEDEEDEVFSGRAFEEGPGSLSRSVDDNGKTPKKELVSALDHYEEAMAKEAEGNMGDSLKLYRKAYRLDNRVDRTYREKHFPHGPQPSKPAPIQSSSAKAALPASGESVQKDGNPVAISTSELIASFAGFQIEPAPPEIEGDPLPPCPIAHLPGELLVHIMQDVAATDVGDFVRLSRVCKTFAYIVASEDGIWRAVALGNRFGFAGMHYHYNKSLEWGDIDHVDEPTEDGTVVGYREFCDRAAKQHTSVTHSLVPRPYSSWRQMFRSRPRIRFNGCYISTVNYIRTGQASTNQATWGGSPIHIVTYYRYLRFFRDGTAVSLLTTIEPSGVVHHLTRALLTLHRDKTHADVPSEVLQKSYRARWRLSTVTEAHVGGVESDGSREGDLTVETESHDPKYMFRMDLSLRTAGKGARNNKLVWRSHFSYNKLTDDWAEFTLKHDKAFFFSRVASYAFGE